MQHPLFPDHEDDGRELGFIRVWRAEKDGARFVSPLHFGSDELDDVSTLFEMFGGGRYEVIAHEANGRVLARHRYAFEGASKPLDGSGGEESAPTRAPAAPVVTAAGESANPYAMMVGLMQMFLQSQQQMAAQQMQMMVALLTKGDQNQSAHVQAMGQLYSQFGKTQADLFQAALSKNASAGDPSAMFMKGLEFAQQFGGATGDAGGESDDPLDGLLESAGQFFAGMQAVKGQAPGAAPAPSVPPAAPASED